MSLPSQWPGRVRSRHKVLSRWAFNGRFLRLLTVSFLYRVLLLCFFLSMSLFVRIVSGVEEASLGFIMIRTGFPSGLVVKNQPANAGDADSIPGSGRSPGEGNGKPLQYSCLENPMDRGAWWATVHGVSRVRHYMLLYLISTAHVYKSNQTFEW